MESVTTFINEFYHHYYPMASMASGVNYHHHHHMASAYEDYQLHHSRVESESVVHHSYYSWLQVGT
jgi:hypothetical protein